MVAFHQSMAPAQTYQMAPALQMEDIRRTSDHNQQINHEMVAHLMESIQSIVLAKIGQHQLVMALEELVELEGLACYQPMQLKL